MNSKTSQAQKKEKPPWSVRLRSWKWWVYGDAYSQPLERFPKGFYWQVAICLGLWVVIAFHPWLTTYINREVPKLDSLSLVEGSVINTFEKDPHVLFKTRDGQILEMEFPVFLNTLGKQAPSARLNYLGRFHRNLVGCEGRIWYDVPVGTLWKRYRIWQIECQREVISVPYRDLTQFDANGLGFFGIFVFLFLPLIGASILFRSSRGNY